MSVRANLSAIKQTKPHEYLIRFCLGGAITVVAGLLAQRYGPEFGGLFLAFPAIFPASATLVEKHEQQKHRRLGVPGVANRGRKAAASDARGAVLGAIALIAFAVLTWQGLSHQTNAILVIASASLLWLIVAVSLWLARRKR
jgi:hypothetical protein